MKRAALPLAAGAAVLVLAGCGGDWDDYEYTPAAGTVTALEHEEAESYQDCGYEYEYDPISGKYKNVYGCDTVYEAECYEVDFQTPEGEVLEECTSEEVFEGLAVGDVYIERMEEQATHTPWLTPSPSPSVSPSAAESSRSADPAGGAPVVRWGEGA